MTIKDTDLGARHRLPQPYGWFHVAFSEDLEPGAVVPARYFKRDLILMRTAGGRPAMLGAYCPHLGAHLGYGGSVVGESIRCPFHSWRFSHEGICEAAPYARQSPAAVGSRCIDSLPVVEMNRCIYAWFHPDGCPPLFDPVSLPEFARDNGGWTPFRRKQWRVRCHIQDIQENGIDVAHFTYVHHVAPRMTISFDGHRSTVEMRTGRDGGGSIVTTHRNGPGQTWARHEGLPRFVAFDPVTPIDDDEVCITLAVSFETRGPSVLERVFDKVFAEMCAQVEHDIPIFDHKIYLPWPLTCDGDGPILEFRSWFSQFYSERV